MQEWVLKRNCSISPNQLAMVYAALCSASLLVAVFFAIRGAWYVLGFAILEMSAVAWAFLAYARHATDRERIALNGDCLLVELTEAERTRQFRLDRCRTRVEPPESRQGLIGLRDREERIEVGRFLTEWKRREFARELQHELQSALASG